MGRKPIRIIYLLLIIFALLLQVTPAFAGGGSYVIDISGDIDGSQQLFVERAVKEAISANASAVIFNIDTFGGYIDNAIAIKDTIIRCPLPTYTFVDSKAISAGALLALAGEQLIMAPASTMGAAEPRNFGERADEKVLSMWTAELSATAETRGRDAKIAAAMADIDISIDNLTPSGKLLTLSAEQSLSHGVADVILSDIAAITEHYDLDDVAATLEPNFKEKMGNWLTNGIVSTILLILGIAGIVIEIFTAGSFGLFGIVGVCSFVLYFMGNVWSGTMTAAAIWLLIGGLVLLIIELFVIPGFGVTGGLGILAMLASLIIAAPNPASALWNLLIALVLSTLIIFFTIKNRKTRNVWRKLILFNRSSTEEGYVAPDPGLRQYIGIHGKAITVLRPAGTAELLGRRVDVVTDGEYIPADSEIEVILVEGLRVVVKAVDNKKT